MANNLTPNQDPSSIPYPMLPPRKPQSVGPIDYINERFNSSIKWYDKEAGKAKTSYLRLRLVAVIGGALVPVLINIELPYLQLVTTVISLLVLLAVSIDSVFHYGEQWSSYRSTEQFLRREYYLFTVNEGPYRALDDELSFQLFVERIEEAIAAENSSTLRVMATVNENKNSESSSRTMRSAAVLPTEELRKKYDESEDSAE